MQNHWLFSPNNIIYGVPKKGDGKKKEDEQTLEEFNSAHRRQLVQTSYIKRI